MPQWLLKGELATLARAFRAPLGVFRGAGGPSAPSWLALSIGALVRAAQNTLPEFQRLLHWLRRQHYRLGD
eukprot:3179517-Pyramimonas_sp.AAC.1